MEVSMVDRNCRQKNGDRRGSGTTSHVFRWSLGSAMLLIAAVMAAGFGVPTASGHTVFKKQLERRYPGLSVKCEACHVKGKPKTETNDFGKLFNVEMASADLTAQWEALEGIEKKKFELETMKPAFLVALDKIKPLENPDGILWAELLDTGKLPFTKLRKGFEIASEGAIPDDQVEELPADDEEDESGDGDSSDDPAVDDETGETPDGDADDTDTPSGDNSGGEGDDSGGEGDAEGGGDSEGGGDGETPPDSDTPPDDDSDQPKDSGGSDTPPDKPKNDGGSGGGGGL